MKQLFKIPMALIAIATASFFPSCNEGKGTRTKNKHEQHEHGGDHTYACPMHPEITGKKGDACSKCGMKLELNDNATVVKNITMQFTTSPAIANPNEEITLSFIPKLKNNPGEPVELEMEHEKKIHLILVNNDLSWFDHIHPEYNNDGSYTVTEKFPAPGRYTLFADYKPSGSNHIVDKLIVNVPGTEAPATAYAADKLAGASENFAVTLTPAKGNLITGALMHLGGTVVRDGKEVDPNTLEDYLGAKAHMVVIGLSDKQYLHLHPEVKDGKFDLHTTFDKPGVYRGWIQFQSEGKLHTVDFTLNVKEGTTEEIKAVNEKNGDPQHHGMKHKH